MTDQTALDSVLLGEGVKQMQEISREEILKQIFGDIGELADGPTIMTKYTLIVLKTLIIFYLFRLYMRCGEHGPPARQDVHHEQIHLLLLKLIWTGEEDSHTIFAHP